MTEQERMDAKFASITHGQILRAARRIAKRDYRGRPNWVLAMDLFGLGSTYATKLCRRAGIDPDSTSADPAGRHDGGRGVHVGREAEHHTEPPATAPGAADALAKQ